MNNMVEILNTDFEFEDERGKLIQIVHDGYKQVNYIESKADFKRGGHYHKNNKELFYVIKGSFILTASKDNVEKKYRFKEGDIFLIDEYVFHTFEFAEDTSLISMYSNGVEYEDGTKDIFDKL